MFEEQTHAAKKEVYSRIGKSPILVLSKSGEWRIEWENPADKSSRAFDLEHSRQQVFIEGYANPVRVDVDNVEYSDPEKDDSADVSLIPSDRYEQFMSQKIVSDALQGGSVSGRKLMMLSMANIGMLIFGIIIVVAVLS